MNFSSWLLRLQIDTNIVFSWKVINDIRTAARESYRRYGFSNNNYASVTVTSALPDKEITVSFPSKAAPSPVAATFISLTV